MPPLFIFFGIVICSSAQDFSPCTRRDMRSGSGKTPHAYWQDLHLGSRSSCVERRSSTSGIKEVWWVPEKYRIPARKARLQIGQRALESKISSHLRSTSTQRSTFSFLSYDLSLCQQVPRVSGWLRRIPCAGDDGDEWGCSTDVANIDWTSILLRALGSSILSPPMLSSKRRC